MLDKVQGNTDDLFNLVEIDVLLPACQLTGRYLRYPYSGRRPEGRLVGVKALKLLFFVSLLRPYPEGRSRTAIPLQESEQQ